MTAPLAFSEDRMILGVTEAEVANGDRFNLKRAREPWSQRWCYLRIDEEEHQLAARRASRRYAARIG